MRLNRGVPHGKLRGLRFDFFALHVLFRFVGLRLRKRQAVGREVQRPDVRGERFFGAFVFDVRPRLSNRRG